MPLNTTTVLCINNEGYEVSLEKGKHYIYVTDVALESLDQIRVIDESGEDYVYPKPYFVKAKEE